MKKHLLSVAATLVACCIGAAVSGCQNNRQGHDVEAAAGEFVIHGQLPAHKYDSACLYLVPMEGPHPRPVDSAFVAEDGTFEFRGNVEQVAVLRLERMRRIGIQELLVVTEPGVTTVVLDSISSSKGTPQNEALQQWKEHLDTFRYESRRIAQMRKDLGANSDEYQAAFEAYRLAEGEYNYHFLKALGRQTVSVFLNKMFTGNIDSLRRAELNELLADTIDYTKPQPGFRR